MATKKKPSPSPSASAKPKAKATPAPAPAPAPTRPGKLHNLAARPPSFDDDDEGMQVDASGVFRVQTSLSRRQRGKDEEGQGRFASDSLVMAAQRDGFREEGPTPDEAVDDHVVEDESAQAQRRERLATLAARAQARSRPRR